MQVQPEPAENGPPTHHCGTPPAARIRKRRQATPPRPSAPASIGDVQRSCKGWPAGSLWREALSSKLRSSLVRERSSVSSGRLCPSSAPPFWRQHFRCTCGAAPWRKASSSITCCTSQRSSVISLVCAAWQLAPHGQGVAQVLQLLRLRCW